MTLYRRSLELALDFLVSSRMGMVMRVISLVAKGKKKTKQGPKGGAKQQRRGGEQQRNMSKVRCFACNQLGHYVGQCPNKKKKKKQGVTAAIAEEEEFASQFERECSLIVCCLIVESPSKVWDIDNGASSHMSGVREHFTDLRDPEIMLEIVLGDDTIIKATEHDTVSFQKELMSPLVSKDVLYVPGLKRISFQFPPSRIGGLRCPSKEQRSSFTLRGLVLLMAE